MTVGGTGDEALLAAVHEDLETRQESERRALHVGELSNDEDIVGADSNAIFLPLAAILVDHRHQAAGFFAVGRVGHGGGGSVKASGFSVEGYTGLNLEEDEARMGCIPDGDVSVDTIESQHEFGDAG